MMNLKEDVEVDFKEAFKSKDSAKLAVLKMIKSSIHNREIELKKELSEEEILKLFFSESKKVKDSIEQFKKGGRDDLVENEKRDLKIIEQYLPEMKSEEEIKEVICVIIKEEEIEKSMSNFGQVMKLAMQKLNGQAEGNIVSELVKKELSQEG
ncbi:GatB/YqeY domain-containing protein [bacterium]|nr:GatB/YqeY domain-containing protein [bacterium]